VKRILKDNDVFFIRCNPQNGIGVPDVIACVRGMFVGIEVKDDSDGRYTTTEAQKRRLKAIKNIGGKTRVVDKNNIDDFERWIVGE